MNILPYEANVAIRRFDQESARSKQERHPDLPAQHSQRLGVQTKYLMVGGQPDEMCTRRVLAELQTWLLVFDRMADSSELDSKTP